MTANGLSCCAITEISGLNHMERDDPTAASDQLWRFCASRTPAAPAYPGCRYAIFSEASYGAEPDPNGYGHRFAAFLRENGLGDVNDSIEAGKNPNSGNLVKIWVWTVDRDALATWLVEEATRRGYVYTPPAIEYAVPRPTDRIYNAGDIPPAAPVRGIPIPPPGVEARTDDPAIAEEWGLPADDYFETVGQLEAVHGERPSAYVDAIRQELSQLQRDARRYEDVFYYNDAASGRSWRVPLGGTTEQPSLSNRLRAAARSIRNRRIP